MTLVTGGTGLLGSYLLYYLTKSGKKVKAIKRFNSSLLVLQKVFQYLHHSNDDSQLNNQFKQIEWVDGDILDELSLNEAFQGVTRIYHAAAIVSFLPSMRKQMMNANVKGTANVVNIALENGIEKMCYVSSIAALGRSNNNQLITESSSWEESKFNTSYAISKYRAELEVWRGIAEGLNTVIVNPSVILGVGNWSSSSTIIFSEVWKGLKFYTDGLNGFVDAKDVAQLMIKLMDSNISNERFIVSSENKPYKYIFDELAVRFNKKCPYLKIPLLLGEIVWRLEALRCFLVRREPIITKENVRTLFYRTSYSNEKIKKALGFEFTPLDSIINETSKVFLKEINGKQ